MVKNNKKMTKEEIIFNIQTDYFQGPIEKLLDLIEEKKLEINKISLAQVTGDFLAYIQKLEQEKISLNLLADFLTIASKLVLIKTKELMPFINFNEEEEEEIKNLEQQLKFYQKLKILEKELKEKFNQRQIMFSRTYLMNFKPIFFPSKNLNLDIFDKNIKKVLNILDIYFKPIVPIKNQIINLKEKIEEILNRITEKSESFLNLTEKKSKSEIVITFLALLHLIKDQLIIAEQKENFKEIILKK